MHLQIPLLVVYEVSAPIFSFNLGLTGVAGLHSEDALPDDISISLACCLVKRWNRSNVLIHFRQARIKVLVDVGMLIVFSRHTCPQRMLHLKLILIAE